MRKGETKRGILGRLDEMQAAANRMGFGEEMRPIPVAANYFITNHGRVFTLNGSTICLKCGSVISGHGTKKYCGTKCAQLSHYHRTRGTPDPFNNSHHMKELRTTKHAKTGYLKFHFIDDSGSLVPESVHSMVALVFIGERPKGFVVNHKDTDKTNNNGSNLEYITHKENDEHASLHGLKPYGPKNNKTKLSSDDVASVFRLRSEGLSHRQIAERFNVTHANISYILRGVTRRRG